MSQQRDDLDKSLNGAKSLVQRLSELDHVTKVMINGSRSPNAKRKAGTHSDWDFIAVSDKKMVYYPSQRTHYNFHADVIFIEDIKLVHYPQACEVWPNDNYKVLNDA